DVPGYLPVVEGDRAVPQDLIGLVPLARDDDGIAGTGHLQSARDRLASVHDRVALGLAAAVHPPLYLFENSLRGLGAGVVGGDDHDVAESRGHRAHEGPFRAIAVAPAAEDGDHAEGAELA